MKQNNIKMRGLALLLTIVMCIGLVPVTFAELDRNNNQILGEGEHPYNVVYKWTGDVPSGAYEQELPEDATLYYTDDEYTIDTKYDDGFTVSVVDEYGNTIGKYTFSGWEDISGCDGIIGTSDINVIGSWSFEQFDIGNYTIEYQWGEIAPEGVNPPSDSNLYVPGQGYEISDDFKTGDIIYVTDEDGYINAAYIFEGWDNEDGIIGEDDIVITGTWSRNEVKNVTYSKHNNEDDTNREDTTSYILESKTLTVDPNTGVWTNPDDTWVETESTFVKVVDENIASIADPSKDDFTFVGWSETKDDDGNILLTAQWEKDTIGSSDENGNDKGDTIPDKYQRKITFKVVNGTWDYGTADPIIVFLTLTDETNKPSLSGTAELTVPEGMLADPNCTDGEWDVIPSSTVTGDLEEETVYTYSFVNPISEYTLTFDVNGGSEIESVTVPENTVISLDAYESTKEGYTFENWYSDSALENPVTSITMTEDTTVYAGWRSNSAVNGGSSVSTGGSSGGGRPTGGIPSSGGSSSVPNPGTVTITDPIVPLAAAPGLNSTDHFAYIIGYEDNTVRPENNITRGEVATIFFRLMTDDFRASSLSDENSFSDVAADDWYNRAVSTCTKAGLINGNPDGTFAPTSDITRAEFAAIAARFLNDEVTEDSSFSDISGHWAENAIRCAVQAGWIKGNGDNTFAPDDYITRAEVMAIINRMLNRIGNADAMTDDMVKWIDNAETAWYYADVQEATNGHKYERDALETSEVWTEIIENPDWSVLEK